MTSCALFRSWRRWIQIWPRLYDFIVTTSAVAMKRLLIGHDGRFGTSFEFHLRRLWQKLWLRVGARMTVITDRSHGVRIFVEQLRCQSRCSISGPNGSVRRMLQSLSRRLGRVMTINAGNLFGAVGTAILGDVL